MRKNLWQAGAYLLLFVFLFTGATGCKRIRKWFKKSPEKKVEQSVAEAPPAEAPPPPPSAESQAALPPPPAAPALNPFGESLPAGATPESAPSLVAPPPINSGTLSVSAGGEKKVSEGSYFLVEDAQALSPLGKPLTYQWSVVGGPASKIQIVKGDALQASFKVLEIAEATPFVLRLTVSDGAEQASSDLKVTAYPAQLTLKSHLGGITRQVERLGDLTYVSRGRTLEIYDASFNLIDKVNLENPALELSAFSLKGKNYLYAITEAGEWWLLDLTDPKNVGKSLVQKSGASFHDLKVVSANEEAYGIALEKDRALLWNLSNPALPQVKAELKGPYQDLKKALLVGKKIYLADRSNLNSIDGATGILNAAIPAGGSISGLDIVENAGKLQLVASLGSSEDKKPADYGLRVFEIGPAGKLINEQRFRLKGNPPIERMLSFPKSSKLLLAAQAKDRLELRAFDLATKTEVPLDFASDPKLAILLDMASGLLNNLPVVILADASALKVLKLSPGAAPNRLKIENLKVSYSTLAAGAVKLLPSANSLFLMDFGSMQNPNLPALLEISTIDLSLKSSLALGDNSYFSDFALTPFPKFNFAANLDDENAGDSVPESAASQPAVPGAAATSQPAPANKDGFLRAFTMDPKASRSVLSAARLFGGSKGGNASRPFGMDAKALGGNIVLATAVAKVSGVGFKSGLYVLRIPGTADPALFLKGDLSQALSYIPLSDARDVKISENGKWALVAAGAEGLAVIDLEKNQLAGKQNPSPGATADRLLISNDQKKIFLSCLEMGPAPAEASAAMPAIPASLYIYYFNEGQLGLWGSVKGLSSVSLPYAVRTGSFDLSSDDIYLFVANGVEGVRVYNASDPSSPVLINKLPTFGLAVSVAVGNKYKNIYIADLINGLEMAEFGF